MGDTTEFRSRLARHWPSSIPRGIVVGHQSLTTRHGDSRGMSRVNVETQMKSVSNRVLRLEMQYGLAACKAPKPEGSEARRLRRSTYFLVTLFAFAAALAAFAVEWFLLWRATAFAISSAESLLCFSECKTSVSEPEFVAIA